MDPAAIAKARMRSQRVWGTTFDDPAAALRWLVAVQAQEFAYAKWSLAQRVRRPSASVVARAYDDGRILRTHVLRPTWHFVAREDLRWLMTLSGPRVKGWSARRTTDLGLDAKTLARTNDILAEAVEHEPLTRRELEPVLQRKRVDPGGQRMPYILMAAELDMVVCSGPMKGKQHTYAPFDARVRPGPRLSREDALAGLAARYFASRGPATVRDFSWWSGLPMADARRGLEVGRGGLKSFEEDGRTYWDAGLASPSRRTPARIDLVQCYDETIIAYRESRDVLQSGGISFAAPGRVEGFAHSILRDGTLLGHWRLDRSAGVLVRVPARQTAPEQRSLDRAVDRVRAYLTA